MGPRGCSLGFLSTTSFTLFFLFRPPPSGPAATTIQVPSSVRTILLFSTHDNAAICVKNAIVRLFNPPLVR